MSKYQKVATVTVSSSSVSIISGLNSGAEVEVTAMDADIWINTVGGTASVAGADCVVVPQNQSIRLTADDAVTSYAAIRDASTDGRVQVGVVS